MPYFPQPDTSACRDSSLGVSRSSGSGTLWLRRARPWRDGLGIQFQCSVATVPVHAFLGQCLVLQIKTYVLIQPASSDWAASCVKREKCTTAARLMVHDRPLLLLGPTLSKRLNIWNTVIYGSSSARTTNASTSTATMCVQPHRLLFLM